MHFTCNDCDFVSTSAAVLTRHASAVHRIEKPHKCPQCGRAFNEIGNMRKHKLIHEKEPALQCDRCSYKANQLVLLKSHVRSAHQNLWYFCEQCEYKASQKSNLKMHIQMHHDRIRCEGDRCQYRNCKIDKLNTHNGIYHKSIQYSCNECEHTASSIHRLKLHNQIKHEGIRYSCNQCEYKAPLKDKLKRHIQEKHEKIKYSCDQCEYKAGQKGHLKTHIDIKHDGIRYSCDKCEHKATQRYLLKKHIAVMHGWIQNSHLLQLARLVFSLVSNNKDIAQSYFLGYHSGWIGWGKDSWWERLILCVLLDLLSSVVALLLYLNYTLFCCFFSLPFKKLIVCFGGLAFLHCSSGKRQEVPSGDWALGNSGQAGKYQHNGEEQTIDSTAQGTNNGEKTPMCKGHTCHLWSWQKEDHNVKGGLCWILRFADARTNAVKKQK